MKKIIFTALITWTLITTNGIADKIDCAQFDKISAENLECAAKICTLDSASLKLEEEWKTKIKEILIKKLKN